jgi:hypothetical protein
MATIAELVERVKAHALAHYTDGGWDVIVECWDDEDIADAIAPATNFRDAIRNMKEFVEIYEERQADARYYAANY